jgi:shikimate dehydrogenase
MRLTQESSLSLAGVMGHPITHSRSPLMHNTMFQENGLVGCYIPIEVKPGHLEPALRALKPLGFVGVNLTIPLKQEAIDIVDEIDPIAKSIGAISCVVVREDGSLFGTNNDWIGFKENLYEAYPKWKEQGDTATVIGGGGGCRAVVYALATEGFKTIKLINRTKQNAADIALLFPEKVVVIDWADRHEALAGSALVVNTTNQGMVGQPPLDLQLQHVDFKAIIADIIYTPLESPLIQDAKALGHRTIGGLGMLLHQVRPAWRMWFGIDPSITPQLRTIVTDDVLRELKG